MISIKHIVILFFLCVSLLACSENIVIATDTPDMIYAAKVYNDTFKNKFPIVVLVSDDMERLVRTKTITYIVSKKDSIQKADFLYSQDFVSKNLTRSFSSTSVIDIKYNDMQMLSFSFPMIVVRKDSRLNQHLTQRHISLEELQSINRTLTTIENEYEISLGFYALDKSFFDVFDSEEQYQEWLGKELDAKVLAEYYQQHYSEVPFISLLRGDEIGYKYVSSHDFFMLPLEERELYDTYFLTDDHQQVFMISPLYIGMLKTTGDVVGMHFLEWLLQEDSQKAIIEEKKRYQTKGSNVFIGNHFSLVWKINTDLLFSDDIWLWNNQPLFSQVR